MSILPTELSETGTNIFVIQQSKIILVSFFPTEESDQKCIFFAYDFYFRSKTCCPLLNLQRRVGFKLFRYYTTSTPLVQNLEICM